MSVISTILQHVRVSYKSVISQHIPHVPRSLHSIAGSPNALCTEPNPLNFPPHCECAPHYPHLPRCQGEVRMTLRYIPTNAQTTQPSTSIRHSHTNRTTQNEKASQANTQSQSTSNTFSAVIAPFQGPTTTSSRNVLAIVVSRHHTSIRTPTISKPKERRRLATAVRGLEALHERETLAADERPVRHQRDRAHCRTQWRPRSVDTYSYRYHDDVDWYPSGATVDRQKCIIPSLH